MLSSSMLPWAVLQATSMEASSSESISCRTDCRSNSNGTYYNLDIEHVNRNSAGFVDFEKVRVEPWAELMNQMIGLDGIAVINIVTNPGEAEISGTKKLQTRITHNDGT
jgi:hypothetical protein